MVSTYDKALGRLKARRNDNSEYAMASRQIFAMSNELNKEQQSINSRIGYTGNSLSAQVGAMLKTGSSIGDIYGKVFREASDQNYQRTNAIDNQIENVTMQRDAAVEREKEAKKAKSEALWKTGITTGMTALGTIIAPGAGTMIGSAVGNMVAGSGILDQTGDADPQMLIAGAADLFQGASSIQSSMANKKAFADASKFMQGPQKDMKVFNRDALGNETPTLNYGNLNPIQQDIFKTSLTTGNYDQMYELMNQPKPKMRMGEYFDAENWR